MTHLKNNPFNKIITDKKDYVADHDELLNMLKYVCGELEFAAQMSEEFEEHTGRTQINGYYKTLEKADELINRLEKK